MAWRYGVTLHAVSGALFFSLIAGIALWSAQANLIPAEFSLGGLALALILAAAGGVDAMIAAAIGAVVGFGLLWLVGAIGTWAFKEEAMGGGDIKMMAMVGSFLGWQGVLLTIFLGAGGGCLIFLPPWVLAKLAKKEPKEILPFGVFLSIGAAITYLVGPALVEWYRHYMGIG